MLRVVLYNIEDRPQNITEYTSEEVKYCHHFGFLLFIFSFFGGTGSYPPLEKGLHLKILQTVIKPPLNAPCTEIASNPYEEQVG